MVHCTSNHQVVEIKADRRLWPSAVESSSKQLPSLGAILFFILATLGIILGERAIAHPGLHRDIEQITSFLAKHPQRPDLLIKRGRLYRLDKKLIDALHDLDRARELDNNNQDVTLLRGLILSALRRDKEAEAELNQVIKKKPVAYAERGYIRARTRRPELAIADFTSAIKMHPTIELYLIRGRLQESLGLLDEAVSGYRDGLTRLPGVLLLKMELIRVEIARKRYKAALTLIDTELTRTPITTLWYLRRADVFTASGQLKKAQYQHQQALAEANRVLRKRTTGIHLVSRAKVYIAMGRLEDAKRDLHLAVKKSPRFREASELLKNL